MSIFSELCVAKGFTGGTSGRLRIDGYNAGEKQGPPLETYPSLAHLTRSGIPNAMKLGSTQQLYEFYKNFTHEHVKVDFKPVPPRSFVEKEEMEFTKGKSQVIVNAGDVARWPELAEWLGKTLPPTPAPSIPLYTAPPLPAGYNSHYIAAAEVHVTPSHVDSLEEELVDTKACLRALDDVTKRVVAEELKVAKLQEQLDKVLQNSKQ